MNNGVHEGDDTREAPPVRATLDAWRARGADRVNPVRFRFIDALARRAAGHEGDARRLLDERLAALIADYSSEVDRFEADAKAADAGLHTDAVMANRQPAPNQPATAGNMRKQDAARPGTLAELVDLLTRRAAASNESEATARHDALAVHLHPRNGPADLPMLDYFRQTWSRFSAEKTLRQSLEQVPDNAGPLNSNSLIHRSLSLMRALSPDYLQQFLSYVEALSWMEQLAAPTAGAGTTAAAAAEAPRTGSAKKAAKGKGAAR